MRRPSSRPPQRRVRSRHRALRARDGAPSVQGWEQLPDDERRLHRRSAAAVLVPARHSRRARERSCSRHSTARTSGSTPQGDINLALDSVAREVGVGASMARSPATCAAAFGDVKEPWLARLRPAEEDSRDEDDDFSGVLAVSFDGAERSRAPAGGRARDGDPARSRGDPELADRGNAHASPRRYRSSSV